MSVYPVKESEMYNDEKNVLSCIVFSGKHFYVDVILALYKKQH